MKRFTAALSALLAAACSDNGQTPSAPPNAAPVAAAGVDQSVQEGATVTLSAAGSSDADGSITGFEWTQISGPSVVLENNTSSAARFAAPLSLTAETFSFRLTVRDNDGAESTDIIDVNVAPAPRETIVETTMLFDGQRRAFSVYTPANYQPGAPTVLLLHGGGRSMRLILAPSSSARRWLSVADREGFLVIAPNGFNNDLSDGLGDEQSWNDLRNDQTGRISLEDDVGFIMNMLNAVEAGREYDTTRIFSTGSSNGGMMTMRLLIERPDDFFGAAAFIGALPQETVQDPLSPTPIMLLNGDEDALILFNGGPVGSGGAPTRSVADTVDYFVRVTGASAASAVTTQLPDLDPADDCVIIQTTYDDPSSSAPVVVFYEARGGGHNIPDPDAAPFSPAAEAIFGNRCRDAHGVDLAFDFFSSL